MSDTTNSFQRLEAVARGRVQGVGFRYFTTKQARRLGLTGWVRNERDGSVRIVAEGTSERLGEFEAALRHGPPGGRVDTLETDHAEASGTFTGFETRR